MGEGVKLRRIALFLAAAVLCCTVCVLTAACGNSVKKIGDIPNMTKGYFAGLESASCVTLNLEDYVKANGTEVTYTAASDNEEVATVTVEGNTLTANLVGNEGYSKITVTVNANGKKAFDLSFTLNANVYAKVACIGDSLTYGHSWNYQSYPVYLQEQLGSGVQVKNFGVNGCAVTNRNEPNYQLKYDTLKEYTNSKNFAPDIVVIMLGSNDGFNWTGSAPTFEEEYRKLIDSYIDNGAQQIVLLTSPPTLTPNAFNLPNDVIKTEVCPRQRALAEEYEFPLLDLRAVFEAHSDLESLYRPNDGVHFSVKGAQLVAELVAETVTKL